MSQPFPLEQRAVIRISGADTKPFLQGLITQNIEKLTTENMLYSLLLNPQGKCLFEFFMLLDNEDVLLDIDSVRAPDLLKMLNLYKLRAAVTLQDKSANWQVLALTHAEVTPPEGVRAFPDPRHPAMGWRMLAPANFIPQSNSATDHYTLARLAFGIPEGEVDNIPAKSLPLENGLDKLHAISFDKGCYVGQEVTARTHWRATLRKAIYIVQANTPLPAPHRDVSLPDGRSVGMLLTTHGTHGLALLRMEAVEGGEQLMAEGITLETSVPEWRAQATSTVE